MSPWNYEALQRQCLMLVSVGAVALSQRVAITCFREVAFGWPDTSVVLRLVAVSAMYQAGSLQFHTTWPSADRLKPTACQRP